jgi:hypothetical protein
MKEERERERDSVKTESLSREALCWGQSIHAENPQIVPYVSSKHSSSVMMPQLRG